MNRPHDCWTTVLLQQVQFAELKKVLLDQRIRPKIRGQFLQAFVRSRLCYNAATWNFPASATSRIETTWMRLLRRCVKNGFRRKGSIQVIDHTADSHIEMFDHSYIYTDKKIHHILGTQPISSFLECQKIKWLAHCIRMPNSNLQKQTMFLTAKRKYSRDIWYALEKKYGLDKVQLRKIMFDKSQFSNLLNDLFTSSQ